MRCLEVTLAYRCSVACVFCSHAGVMAEFGRDPVSRRELAEVLRRKRAEGFGHVTFTGGEPTLYPRFWEILRLARTLGFRTRVISNGSALSIASCARRVLASLDELCLSIHGPDAELHDRLTSAPGAFARMLQALENVDAFPGKIDLVVNTAVTSLNVDRLPEIAALAGRFRRTKEIWVSTLVPIGDGLERFDALAVSNSAAMSRRREIVAAAAGIPVRFYGFPYCALGGMERQATTFGRHPAVTVFRARDARGRAVLREMDTLEADPPRLRTERCAGCVHAEACGGPWKRYVEAFGDSELRPILQ